MIIPFNCESVRVTSCYGERVIFGQRSFHHGYDMVGVGSSEVTCAAGGTVVQSQIVTDKKNRTWEWGNYVCVKTDNGQYHYYCHLKSRAVQKGQRVNTGDRIGIMGATGKVTGAHLHFEVRAADGKTKLCPEGVLGIANRTGVYTASSLERDLEVLVKRGIINSPLYWRETAKRVQYLPELIHNFVKEIG